MHFSHKWLVLALLIALLPAAAEAKDVTSFLLMNRQEAETIRDSIQTGQPETSALAARLRHEADRALEAGPWSVTYHRPKDVPGIGLHDFFSEGPYWWPDPKNPDGPYIRRDGERYPGRFTANDDDMGSMSQAVFALGMGSYFLQESRYANRAIQVLSVWFLDEKTRMTPHLEFGQAIQGINTGRGIGIIDTVQLIWAVQGMLFMENSGYWKGATLEGVEAWFGKYLEWLTESKKGLDEKKNGNNHSTWWTSQVAAYSIFAGDASRLRMAWANYRDYLVPHQIQPDGSCPLEEARTKSLGYSAMNLNGFSLLCRMAEVQGEDLWHFKTDRGQSLAQAIGYLRPFVADPSTWKKQQISPYQNSNAYFLLWAGMGMKKQEYLDLYCRIRKGDDLFQLELDLLIATQRLCAPRGIAATN
jgi:hypothetical protein